MKKVTLLFIINMLWGVNLFSQSKIPQPISADEDGFVSIFDGQTLNGWEGDSVYWRVEDGRIIGEVTPETLLENNSFLIWRGGTTGDFELTLEYNVSAEGNSGINYRSVELDERPFALKGYQCDIDGKNRYTGQNYEEKKRTTLAYRGEKVIINTQINPDQSGDLRSNVQKNCWQTRNVVGSLGEADSLTSKIKHGDWNQVHLIVKENRLEHYINGTLMSEVIDNDLSNRKKEGLLGVQVHVGPPMTIEYRNIRIKNL